MGVAYNEYLDCRGMACPMPIVRVSRAMKLLAPGQTLRVEASDAAFPADLEAWLSMRSDKLLALEVDGDQQMAVIQKSVEI